MKKASFYIYGNFAKPDKTIWPVDKVDGYLFKMGGYTFGLHKQFREWNITEISTGMKVLTVYKRQNAIPEMTNRNTIKAIEKIFAGIVKGDKIDTANMMIQKAYEREGIPMPVL